jgi:hypothetical protein
MQHNKPKFVMIMEVSFYGSKWRGGRRMTLLLASTDWKWGDASSALELVYRPGEAGEG